MEDNFGKGITGIKNHNIKKQINNNITQVLTDSSNIIAGALNILQNQLNNINQIYDLQNKEKEEITNTLNEKIEQINQQKQLIISAVNNINTIFPQFPIKNYLINIQKIGIEIANKIKDINNLNYSNFSDFQNKYTGILQQLIEQKRSVAYLQFKNQQLNKQLQLENAYIRAYLKMICEDTSPTITINNDGKLPEGITMTNGQNPVQPNTNKQTDITTNTNSNPNADAETTTKEAEKATKELQQFCKNIFLTICKQRLAINFLSNYQLLDITADASLTKIIKLMIKDTANKTNYKFTMQSINNLIKYYFMAGICSIKF